MSDALADRGAPTASARAAGWASPRWWFSAVVMSLVASSLALGPRVGLNFTKAVVPLKKELHDFSAAPLLPEYELHPHQPPRLKHEMEASLGTTRYMNALLRDRTKALREPDSLARVFVSYYSGPYDMVPHRPEECMVASGWSQRSASTHEVSIDLGPGGIARIPLRVLEFSPPGASGDSIHLTVMYFFFANWGYWNSRNGVRVATMDPFAPQAFYSKVELSFTDDDQRTPASREASIAGAERLLRRIWPQLLRDHFADPPGASPTAPR